MIEKTQINNSNKKKVLMVQGLHEEGQKLFLARDDIEPITIMSSNEDEIMEAAKDVHGITVRTANISRKIIENANNLLIVSSVSSASFFEISKLFDNPNDSIP
mgnify:CR=1 FL=1